MFRKMMVVILAVLFLGTLGAVAATADTTAGSSQCTCAKGCKCEHCVTGKGECMCKSGTKGCTCGKGCKCEHCVTGKGECMCKSGAKGCTCAKGCKCEHCVTGKGECMCKSGMKEPACRKCDHHGHCRTASAVEEVPPNIANDKTALSQKGMFKVSYTPEPAAIPVSTIHTWKLTVLTADGAPVKDATIKVSGAMPAHGHGLPTQPQVGKGADDGTYVVEGMKFSMPGWWNISFGITVNGKSDVASFNLQL